MLKQSAYLAGVHGGDWGESFSRPSSSEGAEDGPLRPNAERHRGATPVWFHGGSTLGFF